MRIASRTNNDRTVRPRKNPVKPAVVTSPKQKDSVELSGLAKFAAGTTLGAVGIGGPAAMMMSGFAMMFGNHAGIGIPMFALGTAFTAATISTYKSTASAKPDTLDAGFLAGATLGLIAANRIFA